MFLEPRERICRVCGRAFQSRYAVNFCGYACYRKYKAPAMLSRLAHDKRADIVANGISTKEKCKILLHPSESLKHFMVKSLVCRILFERGRSFVCEALVENGRSVDVCDLSLQIAYEVEPSKSDAKTDSKFGKYGISPAIKDIIVIPYNDLPDEINAAHERLKEMIV